MELVERGRQYNENRVYSYFQLFDRDADGWIGFEEFGHRIRSANPKKEYVDERFIEGIFKFIDENKDGRINYMEFSANIIFNTKKTSNIQEFGADNVVVMLPRNAKALGYNFDVLVIDYY